MNQQLGVAIAVAVAAMAWVGYAEHPTARSLRKAIVSTMEALIA